MPPGPTPDSPLLRRLTSPASPRDAACLSRVASLGGILRRPEAAAVSPCRHPPPTAWMVRRLRLDSIGRETKWMVRQREEIRKRRKKEKKRKGKKKGEKGNKKEIFYLFLEITIHKFYFAYYYYIMKNRI
jgi:hypothetical protein